MREKEISSTNRDPNRERSLCPECDNGYGRGDRLAGRYCVVGRRPHGRTDHSKNVMCVTGLRDTLRTLT